MIKLFANCIQNTSSFVYIDMKIALLIAHFKYHNYTKTWK